MRITVKGGYFKKCFLQKQYETCEYPFQLTEMDKQTMTPLANLFPVKSRGHHNQLCQNWDDQVQQETADVNVQHSKQLDFAINYFEDSSSQWLHQYHSDAM